VLTSDQSIVVYTNGQAIPDRLTRGKHDQYRAYADRMLAVYRHGVGSQRKELHRAIENILADEPDCPPRRIAAFCKLLDDAGEFDVDKKGCAAALRLRVFAMAAAGHPLVAEADQIFERTEAEVKAKIAAELKQTWAEIDGRLYADVIAYQRLTAFTGYENTGALLSRYNVAQLQACLYRAGSMTIEAATDFKTLLRYAKLARLLHEITRLGDGRYRLDLSGPASVVMETRRYGVNFARFIPSLLVCRDWTMSATVPTPWGVRARLSVSSEDGLKSHLPPPEDFDSTIEETFAAQFGPERDGWQLSRESEILHDGQTTFLPDFVFRHADGRTAFLEIVGFWTPEYLEKKRQTVARFREHNVLLAVPHRSLRADVEIGPNIIVYKTRLKVEAVLVTLGAIKSPT
jgi:hypothetical protein